MDRRLTSHQLFLSLVAILWVSSAQALKIETEFQGIEGELLENVELRLSLLAEKENPRLTVARLHQLKDKAVSEAAEALQPFGYYRAKIELILEQKPEPETWLARMIIDPGPPVRLSEVDYRIEGEGADDPVLARAFPLKIGDVLLHKAYDYFKDDLLQQALMHGYLDARYSRSEIRVDLERYAASIHLLLDTGAQYYIGKLTIDQGFLEPDLVNRLIGPLENERYNQEKLIDVQRTLADTNYFHSIEVKPEHENRVANHVPLTIELTPQDKDHYRIGVGFATDVGPRLSFDWDRRLINRKGHTLEVETRLSPVFSRLTGRYRVPLERARTDYFAFEPELAYYNTDSRKGALVRLGFLHSSLRNDWQRVLGLEYHYETNDLNLEDERGNFYELVPSIQLTTRKADNLLRIDSGYKLDFRLLGAWESLLSSGTYLQGKAFGKWIQRFWSDYRFLTRAELGATWADSLAEVSVSRRFYAGGDVSIRGYGFEEVAPENDAGETTGGRFLGVASVELERMILDDWALALFVDGGGAFDPDRTDEVAVGVGFGVRWFSPIGPVRADLGFPVTEDDVTPRLHITIGPDL